MRGPKCVQAAAHHQIEGRHLFSWALAVPLSQSTHVQRPMQTRHVSKHSMKLQFARDTWQKQIQLAFSVESGSLLRKSPIFIPKYTPKITLFLFIHYSFFLLLPIIFFTLKHYKYVLKGLGWGCWISVFIIREKDNFHYSIKLMSSLNMCG